MSARALNLLVFRDGRQCVSGAELRSALMAQLEIFSEASPADLQALPADLKTGALLHAGELECAVADATDGQASTCAELTDILAEAYLRRRLKSHFQKIRQALAAAPLPEEMTVSAPEGFAYYALQPRSYSQVLDELPALPERAVVIGIRSIGTTLSAVTAAGMRLRGSQTIRFTVRPGGHPYSRETEFSAEQRQIIQTGISGAAGFLIVDEGPGLSGSSFLSVAEALETAGVLREKITLLPAHAPNPEALCSTNGGQRWRRFNSVPVTGESCRPHGVFVGGGEWRSRTFKDESAWPAVWRNLERVKYLSPANAQGLRLFKFAGFGHYGDRVLERERCAAAAGFSLLPRPEENGFVSYPWLNGPPLSASDLSHQVIVRLAEYCAFRAKALSVPAANLRALQEMAEHNFAELGFDLSVALELERPVIADGHMQPHEWIMADDGKVWKTDCGSHGDDHFFPGPTDIAWDLAGAIVEWRMNADQAAEFLRYYHHASGDDPISRINDFVRAYTVFRCAYCRMAANAMRGTTEQERLESAAQSYTALLTANHGFARQGGPPAHSIPASLAS